MAFQKRLSATNRIFTAAFNAGIEFSLSIASNLASRQLEVLNAPPRDHNLHDLAATLAEMKLDEEGDITSVAHALAACARDVPMPGEEDLAEPMVTIADAMRIYAESIPIDKVVAKALYPERPDGFLISREGQNWEFYNGNADDDALHKIGFRFRKLVFCGEPRDIEEDCLPF